MKYIKTGRKRDPQGYYILLIAKEAFNEIRKQIEKIREEKKIIVEEWPREICIKSKSRSILKRIINIAKARRITVEGEI